MSDGGSTWYSGQVAVYRILNTSQNSTQPHVKRIELCLDEAKSIMEYVRTTNNHASQQRFRRAFTALADGDSAVGLLAYYLWRRQAETQPFPLRRRR
ncbi:MAG: hypothetical protein KJ069_26035 [Anaerolineae bacterium]|nr:hypothetical protein [Anaerolineae bacterium]